jgi:acetolactate synthase-1/2/3 large subunit
MSILKLINKNLIMNNTNGAEQLVKLLKGRNVDTIFCITGAGNLAIVDALVRESTFKIIYSHHEQAAVMEAQGYSRVSGKPGVVIVTTGGGTSNTLTGVLSAFLDSVPVLIISGNESSYHCESDKKLRAFGVQGFDSVQVLQPVTKFSLRIESTDDLEKDFDSAWQILIQDRKGPVHIDFPLDLQRKILNIKSLENIKVLTTNELTQNDLHLNKILIDEIVSDLSKYKKPVLYIGNGCRSTLALEKIIKLIELLKIPFFLSWSAMDLISNHHELYIGKVGIYGERSANLILQQCDLLVCLGTRLAIPQVGYDKDDFARKAKKWVIEIDLAECEKFKLSNWCVFNIEVTEFLNMVESKLGQINCPSHDDWIERCSTIMDRFPLLDQTGNLNLKDSDSLHSIIVMNWLNDNIDDDALITTDVGAALLSGHYMLKMNGLRRIFTSQGLGEMGFGLPGAIGAFFGSNNKQLISLNTDGGIMFNLQELQLIKEYKIPLKLFIFNNSGYSMIKISQDNLFSARHAGSTLKSGISFPNFEEVAKTFGMNFYKANRLQSLNSILLEKLGNNESILVEIKMSPEQRYLPRLATKKLENGTLVSPPLEDLDPLISIETLEEMLGYAAHPFSYVVRGLPKKYEEN